MSNQSASSLTPAAEADRKNVLPNASFELEFGETIPTNWADLQNVLTLKATAMGQQPEDPPMIEPADDAVDGLHAAKITLAASDNGAAGHLTSPAMAVRPCQAYTLSVYARSDEPSARLQLGLWRRPVDFTQSPDSVSKAIPLGPSWQRYQFTLLTDELENFAVVDFAAAADKACTVLLDAAQLEEGPKATAFQT